MKIYSFCFKHFLILCIGLVTEMLRKIMYPSTAYVSLYVSSFILYFCHKSAAQGKEDENKLQNRCSLKNYLFLMSCVPKCFMNARER